MVICLSCGEGALTSVCFQAPGPEGFSHWTGWQDQKHEGNDSSHFHKGCWSCAHTLSKNAKLVHICCNVMQMHSGTVTYSTAGFSLYLQLRHSFPLAHFNSCFLLEPGSFLPNQRPDGFPSAVDPTLDPRSTPDALPPTAGPEVPEFTSSERSSSL